MTYPLLSQLTAEPASKVVTVCRSLIALACSSALLLQSPMVMAAETKDKPATAAPAAVSTPTPPPQYNLLLATLSGQKITQWRQINQQAGYFNQPEFSRDGSTLYYTAQQQGMSGSQMDIASYQLATGHIGLVANTELSEYSPTVLPNQQGLSAVVVEADGQQRLWQLQPDQQPKVLIPELYGVGYHAWGPQQDLLIFQLGKTEVEHQIVYRHPTGQLKVLAQNIGRGLAWQPGQPIGYFTERTKTEDPKSADRLALSWYNVTKDQLSRRQLLLPEGAQDIRWLSSKLLLTSAGNKIYSWQPAEPRWQLWLDLAPACQGSVSRFALSPDQARIAFVCQPKESL
jgi:hypothetical protein